MARPNRLKDAEEEQTRISQVKEIIKDTLTEELTKEFNDFTETTTVHDLLGLLFEYFEDDQDGKMLVAALGKHVYDRQVRGSDEQNLDSQSD